jgi:dTDP-L-rhamnose 4-epimerase
LKVLISGGAGFIGSRTALRLSEQGHEVTVLDNLAPPGHAAVPELPVGVRLVQGDVRNRDDWVAALEGAEVILHLADHHDYLPAFSKLFQVNAVGTALLCELLVDRKTLVRRLVVGSSLAVYGEGRYRCPQDGEVFPDPRPAEALDRGAWEPVCPRCGGPLAPLTTDETATRPSSVYGLSKLAQEEIAWLVGPRHGIETVVLRYGVVQGGGQPFQNAYYGALRIFALRLALDRPIVLFEDGNQLRDFVDVDDVARANVLAVGPLAPGVYNVASGRANAVAELARILLRVAERDGTPETRGLYRLGDPRHVIADVTRLKAAGWEPKQNLEGTVRDYWQWLRAQPNLDSYFEGADHLMERTGTVRVAR